MTDQRFEETIGGQRYTLDVTPVQGNRWRACLHRGADIPSALMPFYGDTPREALEALVGWLARAHGDAADSP